VAVDDEAAGEALQAVRGGEVERVAGRHLGRAAHEGDDLLLRPHAGRARDGERGAEQRDEVAARDAVELGGARRELALRRLGELGRALALLDAAPEARRLGSFGPVDDLETTRALAAALRFVVMVVAAHR
jgi:hypothetical protein